MMAGQARLEAHHPDAGQAAVEAQSRRAGHEQCDAQGLSAGQKTSEAYNSSAGQRKSEAHDSLAGQSSTDTQKRVAGQNTVEPQFPSAGDLEVRADLIVVYSGLVSDLERSRICVGNRISALTRPPENHGKGMDENHPDILAIQKHVPALLAAEKAATKLLEAQIKAHPIYGPFVAEHKGVGLKTLGRLVGLIGDPVFQPIYEIEKTGEEQRVCVGYKRRTVSALWAYCGLHVIDGKAPKRRRNQKANWNTKAKTRVHLIIECCIKAQTSRYAALYYKRKARTEAEDRWSTDKAPVLHRHLDAMRVAGKELLKDLWITSAKYHGFPSDPRRPIIRR